MTSDRRQTFSYSVKASHSGGKKQTWLMAMLLGAAVMGLCASGSIQRSHAAPRCQIAQKWEHWGDAERGRLYMNEISDRFLLEYDANGSEGSAPTRTVFWTDLTVPAGTYKLQTVVQGGHSDNGFQVLVDGAVDAKTRKPVSWSVRSDQTRSLAATVRTTSGRISLRVRAFSKNKTWSTVGPTTVCS